MDQNNYIFLFRKLEDWQWFDSSKHVHLYIYILLKAQWKGKYYRDIYLDKGQMLTSFDRLCKATGLGRRAIRTVLKDLENGGEVTRVSTSQYTIITVCNWLRYQPSDTRVPPRMTLQGAPRMTHIQEREERKEREEVEESVRCNAFKGSDLIVLWNKFASMQSSVIEIRVDLNLPRPVQDKIIERLKEIPLESDWKNIFDVMDYRINDEQIEHSDGTSINWILKPGVAFDYLNQYEHLKKLGRI